MKFLHLNFLPRSADFGLLLLRVWFGGAMLILHGWGKLANYSAMAPKFADPFGLGPKASFTLVVFAELVCAGLIVLGLFTRVAAFVVLVTMAIAFKLVHGARLTGEGNGELPFAYLGAFLVLLVAGAGKYSVDAKIGAKT